MHHARTQASHFQHFIIADAVDLTSLRNDAGVGSVDAVHIGVDFTGLSLKHGSKRYGGRIRRPSAKRGEFAAFVDALEARANDDLVLGEFFFNSFAVDALDASPGVRAVGDQPDLPGGQADGLLSRFGDGHRHERDRHLFACG